MGTIKYEKANFDLNKSIKNNSVSLPVSGDISNSNIYMFMLSDIVQLLIT